MECLVSCIKALHTRRDRLLVAVRVRPLAICYSVRMAELCIVRFLLNLRLLCDAAAGQDHHHHQQRCAWCQAHECPSPNPLGGTVAYIGSLGKLSRVLTNKSTSVAPAHCFVSLGSALGRSYSWARTASRVVASSSSF